MLHGLAEIDRPLGRTWNLEEDVRGSAIFSRCGNYRPYLSRCWGEGRTIMWLCMNPSSATDQLDDATSKKLTRHSRRLGYSKMFLLNVMDYRATDPRQIHLDAERSNRNIHYITKCAALTETVVFAYGRLKDRRGWKDYAAEAVQACRGIQPQCVLINRNGSPRHPRNFPARFALRDFN